MFQASTHLQRIKLFMIQMTFPRKERTTTNTDLTVRERDGGSLKEIRNFGVDLLLRKTLKGRKRAWIHW